jgi:hypothetical protein
MVVAPPNGLRAAPQYLLNRKLLLKLHRLLEAGKNNTFVTTMTVRDNDDDPCL